MKHNNNQTRLENPLNNPEAIKKVSLIFGGEVAQKICTTPVYKYSHKGIGEGMGDQRNKK